MTNSPILCTRRIEFDAAHRVFKHEGKCKHLHGHRYALEATFAAANLDKLGRVVDFAVIKEVLGAWIMEHWDHATILFDKDKALGKAISNVTGQKIFTCPKTPPPKTWPSIFCAASAPSYSSTVPSNAYACGFLKRRIVM